jgi:hypothetical protein
MKITKSLFHVGVLGLSLLATAVMAAVPAAEADKLGKSLDGRQRRRLDPGLEADAKKRR